MAKPQVQPESADAPRIVVDFDDVLRDELDDVARRLRSLGMSVRQLERGAHNDGSRRTPLLAGVDTAVVIVTTRTLVDERTFDASPHLRGVVFLSAGVDSCDLDRASAAGVLVTNGPTEANVQSMAEAQVMAMLALSYRLGEKVAAFANSDADARELRHRSRTLSGRVVGFLGYGRIARAVTARLSGWGLAGVLAHTRSEIRPRPSTNEIVPERVSLDDLLRRSDIVCVNVPLSTETAGMLGRPELLLTRPGTSIVVQSRGGIVDEEALAELTASGHLSGVAIDTFENEPVSAEHPLRAHASPLLTAHNIGHTEEMFMSFAPAAVEAVEALCRGDVPEHTVNVSAAEAWRARWETAAPAGSR